jgi:hypothetical protein
MTEERAYPKVLFKAASNKAFFEVYDALDIDKLRVYIHDYEDQAKRADFYVNYEEFLGLCEVILAGTWGDMYNKKSGWPHVAYGISMGTTARTMTIQPPTDDAKGFAFAIKHVTKPEGQLEWSTSWPQVKSAFYPLPRTSMVEMAAKIKMEIYRWWFFNYDRKFDTATGKEIALKER